MRKTFLKSSIKASHRNIHWWFLSFFYFYEKALLLGGGWLGCIDLSRKESNTLPSGTGSHKSLCHEDKYVSTYNTRIYRHVKNVHIIIFLTWVSAVVSTDASFMTDRCRTKWQFLLSILLIWTDKKIKIKHKFYTLRCTNSSTRHCLLINWTRIKTSMFHNGRSLIL